MPDKILVDTGKILEVLNTKVGLDAGNYKGSLLEEYIHDHSISDKTTNCITELPQNIKLELNDGVLTLKKGSKVTVPNGVGKFDELEIDADKTFTSTADGTFAILVNTTTKAMVISVPSKTISGETDSLSTITYRTWYDTANNLVKRYNANASTIDHYCSLPIAMITVLNGAISSIDEVFNGLGQIGSHIWRGKGIKYLVPNGRNEDGSLNNIEVTTTNVTTQTIGANTYYITLSNNGTQGKARKADTFFQEETPTNYMTNSSWYKPSENQWYRYTNNQWTKIYMCPIGEFTANSSRVTNFKTYNAFRAVDYNDKAQIGTWSLPSAKYTDLTLGASGSAYTMPVNGWIYFLGDWNNQSTYIQIQNVTKGYKLQTPSISALGYYGLMMPVSMGDSIKISYTVAPTNVTLRIMHLQGEL